MQSALNRSTSMGSEKVPGSAWRSQNSSEPNSIENFVQSVIETVFLGVTHTLSRNWLAFHVPLPSLFPRWRWGTGPAGPCVRAGGAAEAWWARPVPALAFCRCPLLASCWWLLVLYLLRPQGTRGIFLESQLLIFSSMARHFLNSVEAARVGTELPSRV